MMQPVVKILFLAANPHYTTPLAIGEEVRLVREELRKAELGRRFGMEQEWAVGFGDVQGHLLRHRPNVVHFSGHGSEDGEIVLHKIPGCPRSTPVSGEGGTIAGRALADLFGLLRPPVSLVVLNACYSEPQARAIAEHVDCVVGMRREIDDRSARQFSAAFYRALGYGEDIGTAFEMARNQIGLANLDAETTPLLALRGGSAKRLLPDSRSLVLEDLNRGIAALEARDYPEAYCRLQRASTVEDPPSEVFAYLALAILRGRHFNALAPGERTEIETLLDRAAREAPEWPVPRVLLGVLELDYYAYNGLLNPRSGSLAETRRALGEGDFSKRDRALIAGLSLGRKTRAELRL